MAGQDAKDGKVSTPAPAPISHTQIKNKVLLVSIDGWGLSDNTKGNAIKNAKTPNMTMLSSQHLFTQVDASGLEVGLPDGVMGNSEVGHLTMGCGRVDFQDLVRINMSIKDGSFGRNPVLLRALTESRDKFNKRVHFLGLVSNGGVHSHIEHLKELLKVAKANQIPEAYLHFFADGRDTAPNSGLGFIKEITSFMDEIKYGKLATVMGRYYAMDRDNRWERTKIAYEGLTAGTGQDVKDVAELLTVVQGRYEKKVPETDEFFTPIIVEKKGLIGDNDTLVFFDYRSDRMRQINQTFGIKPPFETKVERKDLHVYQFTQYNAAFPMPVIFPPQSMDNVLSEWISKHGLHQFHTAETEKYAHVTFFFNGGREAAFANEDRFLIPSPKVATYDLAPPMSMSQVGDKIIEAMARSANASNIPYSFIMCNLAAPDMVGHTGVYDATVKACEACDVVIGRLWEAAQRYGYVLVITADHGNAEEMFDEHDKPKTSHTTNFVPLIVAANSNVEAQLKVARPKGGLKDVAPTVLELMGLSKPADMTGSSMVAWK